MGYRSFFVFSAISIPQDRNKVKIKMMILFVFAGRKAELQ